MHKKKNRVRSALDYLKNIDPVKITSNDIMQIWRVCLDRACTGTPFPHLPKIEDLIRVAWNAGYSLGYQKAESGYIDISELLERENLND